jgi:hypothetical protein
VTDYDFKEYPPQASAATNIASGLYYFSAWSQDFEGNWSSGVNHSINMPKAGVQARNIIIKEANFQPKEAGSTDSGGVNYTVGDVTARDSPRSNGVWFHGNQFSSSIGFQGNPTVKNARIRIARAASDGGQNVANVRLFHHNQYEFVSPFTDFDDATIVGTLTRGETKVVRHPRSMVASAQQVDQRDSACDLVRMLVTPSRRSGRVTTSVAVKSTWCGKKPFRRDHDR